VSKELNNLRNPSKYNTINKKMDIIQITILFTQKVDILFPNNVLAGAKKIDLKRLDG
jgi:hypothetical protein